jgi:aminoglycoside 3-N-acetyltransferase
MTLEANSGVVGPIGSDLADTVRSIGVESGDCLLVHSNVTTLLESDLTIPSIIDQLLDVIGDNGTLVLPTFNFGWCDGNGFDYRRTPSQTGLLTEWARRDPRFVRTAHPVYSFAVAGRRQADFTAYDCPSAYGVGSGFDVVHDLGGKILVIGLPWSASFTFFHYIEEQERVSYRYFKPFAGMYRDGGGKVTRREYFLYVRDLEAGVETYLDDAERHFLAKDLAQEAESMRTRFILVEARDLYKETAKQLRLNPQFLHRIKSTRIVNELREHH